MRFRPRGRTIDLRAGAFLTLLAAWALAPATASASCGDYVTSRAQRESHGIGTGHDMPHGGSLPGRPPGERRPCSGPSCSGGPAAPDAPVMPSPIPAETWCDTAGHPRCAGPEPVAGLFDPPILWPPRRASDLDRPPCGLHA